MLHKIPLSKSRRTLKLHAWFKSYGDFAGLGRFCIVVELHRGESATNRISPVYKNKNYKLSELVLLLVLVLIMLVMQNSQSSHLYALMLKRLQVLLSETRPGSFFDDRFTDLPRGKGSHQKKKAD